MLPERRIISMTVSVSLSPDPLALGLCRQPLMVVRPGLQKREATEFPIFLSLFICYFILIVLSL